MTPGLDASHLRLTQTLKRGLDDGAFPIGQPLPPIKWICRQYRVSASTATLALRQLTRDGALEKTGKTFWVAGGASRFPIGEREVWVFCQGGPDFGRRMASSLLGQAYYTLFSLLCSQGVRLRGFALSELTGLLQKRTRRGPSPGLLFFDIHHSRAQQITPILRQWYAGEPESLSTLVLDCARVYNFRLSADVYLLARTRIEEEAARTTARFLKAQGIRRALFMWPGIPAYNGWAPNRAALITEELQRLEHPCDLTKITLPLPSMPTSPQRELGGRTAERLAQLWEPLFVEARSHSRHRFWIGANDWVACAAKVWLEYRSSSISGSIKILGYDNSMELAHHNVSSYDFGMENLGRLMAHALLNAYRMRTMGQSVLPCEGRIIEKGTT